MDMVRHYDVREQKKTARGPSFVNRSAGNYLNGVGPKDQQAVLCYCSYEQTWIVF
jgi:hypothetical protein